MVTSVRAQGWQQATAAARWVNRANHTSVVFDGRMWVLGGIISGGSFNDVWYSTDGAAWSQATPAAGWAPRGRHASVVYDNRMWLMGGWEVGPPSGNEKHDVWYSADGNAWTQATAAASWVARENLTAVVFDGRMWILGGLDHEVPQRWRNDVWYSTDGANWTQATATAGWQGRGYHTSVVFDNRLWVMGGLVAGCCNPSNNRNDVWPSADGTTWAQVNAAAPWSARFYHASAVFRNQIWVLGGYDSLTAGPGPLRNDTWMSPDGAAWTERDAAAEWSGRFGHSTVVYDGRLWVMGGETPVVSAVSNDVWFLGAACTPPSIEGQPASRSLCEGDSLLLSVAARGDPPLRYQWRKAGVGIAGATGETLVIDAVAPADSGTYDVEVSNACGSIISPKLL